MSTKKLKNITITISLTFIFISLIFSAEIITTATIKALTRCFQVIIPSFFGFLVISNMLISTNCYQYFSAIFSVIARYIFRIEGKYFSIFILSSIGGYPIGIKTLTELHKKGEITKEKAEKLICYSYCVAPSFAISAVGIFLYQSEKIGAIIYFSCLLSNIILGIFLGLKEKIPQKEKLKTENVNFSLISLHESINSATLTLLLICTHLIFFTILVDLLSQINFISTEGLAYINSFIEVSGVTDFESKNYSLIPIITGFLAFGGLSVLSQVFSINNGLFSLKKFVLTRFFQVLMAVIFSHLLTKIFLQDEIITISTSFKLSRIDNFHYSFFLLLIMTFYLLKNVFAKKI